MATAIIGPSGAGKTTIVNLLLRLYEPSSGVIFIDDTPLSMLRRADWLTRVAVAGQDVELIEGTVADNIALSRPSASPSDIAAVAQVCGIDAFVAELPDGLHSWIGERGLNLSGGQRQRVGLARALMADPEILILDEATNAMDSALEQKVLRQIASRMAGRTIILITHRAESLTIADHILTIRQGKVCEQPGLVPPAALQGGLGECPDTSGR